MNIIDELKTLAHYGEEISTTGYTLRNRYDIYLDSKPTSADLANIISSLGCLIQVLSVNALRELGEYPIDQNYGESEKNIAIAYAQALKVLAAQWKYETAEMIRRSTPENLEKLWGKDPDSTNIEYYKRACERLDDASHLDKALIAAIKNDPQAVAKHLGFFRQSEAEVR